MMHRNPNSTGRTEEVGTFVGRQRVHACRYGNSFKDKVLGRTPEHAAENYATECVESSLLSPTGEYIINVDGEEIEVNCGVQLSVIAIKNYDKPPEAKAQGSGRAAWATDYWKDKKPEPPEVVIRKDGEDRPKPIDIHKMQEALDRYKTNKS